MDRQALAQRIAQHVSAAAGVAAEVIELAPLIGGACQDLFRVELRLGGEQRRLVLRSDAARSLPGSLPRRDEYRVIRLAVGAGVCTPAVYWPAEDLVRPGASAYFMDWAAGQTIARKVLRDPDLAAARARLPGELAAELARLHRITADAHPDLALVPPDGASPREHGAAGAALRHHRAALDALPEPRPVLELALRWLEAHRPPERPLCLCHGDFRTGNFAVTPQGLSALLDWEFAHWGDPHDDLGWMFVRDWRFGQLDRPAGGLADRHTFFRAYEAAGGAPLDPDAVHYWELMGNVRWCIGAIHQGERYLAGAERDLELLAIGRRVPQLEWEILRLLERG